MLIELFYSNSLVSTRHNLKSSLAIPRVGMRSKTSNSLGWQIWGEMVGVRLYIRLEDAPLSYFLENI